MSLLLREAIGGTIRRTRIERRRTLRDVSRDARVSLGYLSEIERGRKEPSSELLAAICEALALPLPELLVDVADALRPVPRRVPAVVGAGATGGLDAETPVDDELRSAVEAAFEPVPEDSDDRGAAGAPGASASAAAPTRTEPEEPEEPAAPRTVALPEPEGAARHDGAEEGEGTDGTDGTVAPVEGATTVRLVGLSGGAGGGSTVPVVCVAA